MKIELSMERIGFIYTLAGRAKSPFPSMAAGAAAGIGARRDPEGYDMVEAILRLVGKK